MAASGAKGGGGRHVAGTRQATEKQQPTAGEGGGGMGAGRAGRLRPCMQVLHTAPHSWAEQTGFDPACMCSTQRRVSWAEQAGPQDATATAQMPPVGPWAAWATVTSPFVRTSSRDLPN